MHRAKEGGAGGRMRHSGAGHSTIVCRPASATRRKEWLWDGRSTPECKVLATQGFCHDLREQILLLETLETGEQSDCNWGGVRRDRFRRGAATRTRRAGERCSERPNSVSIVGHHEHTGEYLHSITIDLHDDWIDYSVAAVTVES